MDAAVSDTDGDGYAARIKRSTPSPVIGSAPRCRPFGRWRIRRYSGDIGHSVLVTKRPSEGHADK
ncbi:hypothetical protein Ate02nite_76350 [Paractinoplanes tereljensis]|uniref:Uncharacterized protein n=1 Tax=Paractinoplanes tereljensis TaxID=571912 RepID=A0A919TY51_9ACTN|nr:hypothetical protein Ate02nite_76350 [Actinoplanes tereljensis]